MIPAEIRSSKRSTGLALVVTAVMAMVATSACDQGQISLGVGTNPELSDGADGGVSSAGVSGGGPAKGGAPGSGGVLGTSGSAGLSGSGGASGVSGGAGSGGSAQDRSLVQMRVSDVDDFLYVTVGGVRRATWSIDDPREGEILDVSAWFAAGVNELRLHGVNTGGPTAFHFELWVDGSIVVDESCATQACGFEETGIVYDRTFDISLTRGPARQSVEVASARPGNLYVGAAGEEIAATDLVPPTTLWLPPGDYVLGVGIADDQPFDYTGVYYERTVSVGSAPAHVDLTAQLPLPVQDTTRIAILPIRKTFNCALPAGQECVDPEGANTGVLLDSDVTQLQAQMQATGDEWIEPFSYGLTSWQVEVLPTVEETMLRELPQDNWDTGCFIAESQAAQAALQQYDMVVFFFSQHKASGEEVDLAYNVAWALGGRTAFISTLFTRQYDLIDLFGPGAPNPYVIFLLLSNYEASHRDVRRFYPGLQGAAGGLAHGYVDEHASGETGWTAFHRSFMRGRVPELSDMRADIPPPVLPTKADLYTGIFATIRRGFAAPAFEPPFCQPN